MQHREEDATTIRLVSIGLLAAVFFSATFILNYSMHLEGGHWAWSAILRFFFMILLLIPYLLMRYGLSAVTEVFHLFKKHFIFWTIAGTIGFGIFYAGICFSADYARGWVVAATWQTTVLATPFVILLFGFAFPKRGILFSAVIVAGVFLVNYDKFAEGLTDDEVIYGVLPILVSAFAYPVGNQLLNAAKNGTLSYVPFIQSRIMAISTACVLLMSLGSIPFWLGVYLLTTPPAPAPDQWISTFFVALFAGVCATGLFLYARNLTSSPYKIAAVDATLSGEVLITLIAEIIFLNPVIPDPIALAGLLVITAGLIAYCFKTSFSE